jgi:hypothetical protein
MDILVIQKEDLAQLLRVVNVTVMAILIQMLWEIVIQLVVNALNAYIILMEINVKNVCPDIMAAL